MTPTTAPDQPIARRRHARGFSLLELMLVLVIIGLLMGVAAVAVVGQGKQARIDTTKTTIRTVKNAVDTFQLQTGSYPATIAALELGTPNQAALLQPGSTDDAWNNQLYYRVNEGNSQRPFELISAGSDQELNTEDDIDVWVVLTE